MPKIPNLSADLNQLTLIVPLHQKKQVARAGGDPRSRAGSFALISPAGKITLENVFRYGRIEVDLIPH